MCIKCAEIYNQDDPEFDEDFRETEPRLFSQDEKDRIFEGVFIGAITVDNLPTNVYTKNAEFLNDGVFKGFGRTILQVEFGTPDFEMLFKFRENIFVFSGAKTYQQVRDMTSFVTDEQGFRRPFSEFKKDANAIFDNYNQNWLKTEYNMSVANARSGGKWLDIQGDKDLFPFLRYKTVGDARVRSEHSVLNNIIRPVNDAFWNDFTPPNGWGCRCDLEQLENGKVTPLKDIKIPEDTPPVFLHNPGKDKIIFNRKHPYFRVAREDRDLARNNFGLPIPGL